MASYAVEANDDGFDLDDDEILVEEVESGQKHGQNNAAADGFDSDSDDFLDGEMPDVEEVAIDDDVRAFDLLPARRPTTFAFRPTSRQTQTLSHALPRSRTPSPPPGHPRSARGGDGRPRRVP